MMESKDKKGENDRIEALAKMNKGKQLLWRNTLSDGFLPFAQYTTKYKEQIKGNLKQQEPLFDEKAQILFKTFNANLEQKL